MGSFNTSCIASRQTISPGDPCIVVAIQQESTYEPVELSHAGKDFSLYGPANSPCNPTCYWSPVSHFFEAQYADYGRVTLLPTKMNLFNLLRFLRDAVDSTPLVKSSEEDDDDIVLICRGEQQSPKVEKRKVDRPARYDLAAFMKREAPDLHKALFPATQEIAAGSDPCTAADFATLFKQAGRCWAYLFEVAQDYQMFWQEHGNNQPRPLNFAIFHEQAWLRLIDITNRREGRKGPLEMRQAFNRALGELKDSMLALEQHPAEDQKLAQRKYLVFSRFRDALLRVGNFEGSEYRGEIEGTDNIAAEFIKGKLSDDQLFDALKPWLSARYAVSAMEELNLHFEPMYYTSQDYANAIGASYRQFVDQVSAAVTRTQAEDGYGRLKLYQVTVTDPSVVPALQKAVWEQDGRLLPLREMLDPANASQYILTIECTLAQKALKTLLTEFVAAHSDNRVLPDTLAALVPATMD